VDAATYLITCNALPYSHHDWHFRLLVAHRFGHAAAAPTVHGTLKLLDDAGIRGELAVREVRSGRVEVVPMWGRPESVRQVELFVEEEEARVETAYCQERSPAHQHAGALDVDDRTRMRPISRVVPVGQPASDEARSEAT